MSNEQGKLESAPTGGKSGGLKLRFKAFFEANGLDGILPHDLAVDQQNNNTVWIEARREFIADQRTLPGIGPIPAVGEYQRFRYDDETESGFIIRNEGNGRFKAEEWRGGDIADNAYGTYAEMRVWTEAEAVGHDRWRVENGYIPFAESPREMQQSRNPNLLTVGELLDTNFRTHLAAEGKLPGATQEFLFDVQLDASITVSAPSEEVARRALRAELRCASANLGEILGQTIVCEVSLNDEPVLAMIDCQDPPERDVPRKMHEEDPDGRFTTEQVAALRNLKAALRLATDTGLFDELVADCKSPDSINDLCDAVRDEMSRVCGEVTLASASTSPGL